MGIIVGILLTCLFQIGYFAIGAAFGAVEEKNRIDAVKTNTLTLIGGISFAGVEIFYI